MSKLGPQGGNAMCCQPAPMTHAYPMAGVAAGCAAQPTVLLLNGQQQVLRVNFPLDSGAAAAAPVPWQTFIFNANAGGVYP